jgi:hypothetical protein
MAFVGGLGPVWSDPVEALPALATLATLATAPSGDQVRPPGVNPRRLPAWGLYARRVGRLNLANLRLEVENRDARPAVILDGVDTLDVDALKCPGTSDRQIILKDVGQINQSAAAIPLRTLSR